MPRAPLERLSWIEYGCGCFAFRRTPSVVLRRQCPAHGAEAAMWHVVLLPRGWAVRPAPLPLRMEGLEEIEVPSGF